MRRARLGLDLSLLALAVGMGLWAWQSRRERREHNQIAEAPAPTPTPSRMQMFMWERQVEASQNEVVSAAGTPERAKQAPSVRGTPLDAGPEVSSEILNVLVIQLTDPEGNPFTETAQVFSLDRRFTEAVTGGRLILQLPPGPCTLQAQFVDAGVIQRSAEQRVRIPEDQPLAVTIVLPRPSRGSVGLNLEPREGYAEIVGVQAGSSAEQLGLRAGDAVLSIDGQSVDGWSGEELEQRLAGRPYEAVDLQVVIRNEQDQFEEHNLRLLRGRGL